MKKSSTVANVLIIDDDKMLCEMLSYQLTELGHKVSSALTMKDGFKKASTELFDIIYLDVRLPDGNGLNILPEIQAVRSSPEVIIMTGTGDHDGAELAIKNGAWDYIEKPSSLDDMILPFIRALQFREIKLNNKSLNVLKKDGIIDNSPQMKACIDLIAQAARSDANVLICGETGTGKELLARMIHHNSRRADNNFVIVDCAALTETLVESILFGYEKGAYTGAERSHEGLIRQADKGTLFLDEVGELPLSMQKSFLRVLQEHRFRPLGSKYEIESDFRIIAATNRNLDYMVNQENFRCDLLYRLRSFNIEVPPLRNRKEDISDLALYQVARLCKHYGKKNSVLTPEFLAALTLYDWPGNVRELISSLDRALAAAGNSPTLFIKHLPTYVRVKITQSTIGSKGYEGLKNSGEDAHINLPKFREFRKATITKEEKQYFEKLMTLSGGNIKNACTISGLSQSRLYELLKKHYILNTGDKILSES